MIGQTLGSYTLERELGRGGMGAVYAAVHGLLGRRAAVKVLLADLSRDQATVQRFFNEARAATAIKHPSIVEIYDFGFAPDGAAFIVMELMEGESLATRLRRVGRLPVANALVMARQAATALAAAHKAGIVHRDLKPDNVFLVADPEVAGGERVKLLDFGIAKLLTASPGAAMTNTGAIMGTPHYMSPEQCEGSRAIDHRSDLYSLGVMLFQMITGRWPFVGEGVGGIIGAHLFLPPPPLRSLAPDAPAEVEAFVGNLLAKNADDRPPSADAVVTALERLGATSGGMVAPIVISAPASRQPIGHAPTLAPPVAAIVPTTLSASATGSASPARSRRGWLVGLVAAVAVAGATTAAIIATRDRASSDGDGVDAGSVATTTDAGLDAGRRSIVADAESAIADRRWNDAVALAQVLERSGDPSAAAIRSRATMGKTAADGVAAMQAAFDRKDFHQVRLGRDPVFNSTLDGDPDRARADAIMVLAKPAALKSLAAKAAKLVGHGDCMVARAIAVEAAVDWGPDDAKAITAAANACHTGSTGGDSAPLPPRTSDDTVAAIRTAVREGQWQVASLRCGGVGRAVLRKQLAFECSLAECKAGHVVVARELVSSLPPAKANVVRRACAANHIELTLRPLLTPLKP